MTLIWLRYCSTSGTDSCLDVVQVHDFVLDVEVEFPTQEAAQVLVNEVVERVAGGVLRSDVFPAPCGLGAFSVGRAWPSSRSQSSKPLAFRYTLDGLLVQDVLLFLAVDRGDTRTE